MLEQKDDEYSDKLKELEHQHQIETQNLNDSHEKKL
jgi:hypothetical protein